MKKNRIMTYIGITLVVVGCMELESELSYILTDVMGWSWLINLWHGMTYTQLVEHWLCSPFHMALFAVEIFVMLPVMICGLTDLWLDETRSKSN